LGFLIPKSKGDYALLYRSIATRFSFIVGSYDAFGIGKKLEKNLMIKNKYEALREKLNEIRS